MSDGLNMGQGRCQSTARLLIAPVQAVIELGASGDVLTKALNAVHHANRHGSQEDFIAVALPTMRMGRNRMLPGHEIELIGSEISVSALLQLDGLQSLIRRGMLQPLEVEETFLDVGSIGAAYVRDRACEKHTAGWLRRNKARAERRGKSWQDTDAAPKRNDRTALPLHYGKNVLHVRQIPAEMTNDPLVVNTYGFSSPVEGRQAVLPVYPEYPEYPEAARAAGDEA